MIPIPLVYIQILTLDEVENFWLNRSFFLTGYLNFNRLNQSYNRLN